ncbi:hypothetical protein D3C84_928420 [compost metagenome]
MIGALARVLSHLDQVGQTNDRDQRGSLENDHPVVANTRQSKTHHLREQHEAETLGTGQAVSSGRLHLATGHSEDRPTESLGEVRPVDKA